MRKGSFAGDALGTGGLNPYSNFALGGPGVGLAGSAFGGLGPLNSMSMQMPSQFGGRSGRADSFSATFGGVSPREVAYSHVRVCCCCVAPFARDVLPAVYRLRAHVRQAHASLARSRFSPLHPS